jgi:hypothetical protein
MKQSPNGIVLFTTTAGVAAVAMLAFGWRDPAGIIGASLGAAIAAVFVGRSRKPGG